MRVIALLLIVSLSSCWDFRKPIVEPFYPMAKVWGNKPVYSTETEAKKVLYSSTPLPVINAGNIYVKGNYIFQLETGKGIHIIDNSVPANARRIGFLTMNGSSQISMKGNFLYTNSYDDLVVVDMSDLNNITEVKRVKGAFPEGRSYYYYVQPPDRGYYQCPRYDSVVTRWVKDSINSSCYKN